ncbi:MAG: hypothetical protein DMG30_21345 [Acidobacteria bacterium]|nr:MAG: hypothetical protein DMG30_21345 [Acidobacteriota bacterium]
MERKTSEAQVGKINIAPFESKQLATTQPRHHIQPVSAARRLDICEPAYSGEVSVLARCRTAKDHSPSRIARRDQQKNWLAYLSILFRMRNCHYTFSTLHIANGENVKVTQELMRHASSRCTLEVYSQVRIIAKRQAQQRVVQMILPEETDTPEPLFACGSQIDIR